MKRYKLLKDLPTFKAGDLFYISQYGDLIHDGGDVGVTAYARRTLDIFPNILTEWFEEIGEPIVDVRWKPKIGQRYFYIDSNGNITSDTWHDTDIDNIRYELGLIYKIYPDCRRVRDRQLAEARLRRTSTFKPDFKNGNGGWVVMYDHFERVLAIECCSFCDSGEPVRYETEEEALKSIKENEKDWLIYFGIKEGE